VLAPPITGGHVLLEDVPGTAQTILARALAQSVEGSTFARIQCTPDFQPTDSPALDLQPAGGGATPIPPSPGDLLVVAAVRRAAVV
jgi:MoxR-like ATPase